MTSTDVQLPLATSLHMVNGDMDPHALVVERQLSHMAEAYADSAAVAAVTGDPVIYRAFEADVPHEASQLIYRTTIIEPGRVGAEFYMTKGHHHVVDSAEFYLGMSGTGVIVMQTRTGEVRVEEMPPGRAVHVPPGWAHRSVNVGTEPFVFLAVFFGNAGHDYASIERDGFAVRVLASGEGYRVG
jgi:glucose-6-phosphate isomerase, archaeal